LKNITRIALGFVFVIFLVKSFDYVVRHGDRLHDQDTGSEDNTITAARNFVQDGFFKSCGLPKYGRYNLDSASKTIAESDYYTHYFPGPDYVLATTSAVFGAHFKTAQWSRLVPLFTFFLAVLFFLWVGARSLWPNQPLATPWIAAFILFAPANRNWVLNLHGHGYVSAYTLAALSLGVLAASWTWSNRKNHFSIYGSMVGAFLLGFASNYMLLTNAFVVCAAPLVGGLLAHSPNRKAWQLPFWLSFVVGLGLVAAFFVHLYQIACLFSWKDALADQLGTLSARVQKSHAAAPISRIRLLGQYSDQVFGFYGLSAKAMALLGLFLAWISSASGIGRKRQIAALALAILAAYAWVLVLPSHASGHLHVNPRIFLLPFVCVLVLLARITGVSKK